VFDELAHPESSFEPVEMFAFVDCVKKLEPEVGREVGEEAAVVVDVLCLEDELDDRVMDGGGPNGGDACVKCALDVSGGAALAKEAAKGADTWDIKNFRQSKCCFNADNIA